MRGNGSPPGSLPCSSPRAAFAGKSPVASPCPRLSEALQRMALPPEVRLALTWSSVGLGGSRPLAGHGV